MITVHLPKLFQHINGEINDPSVIEPIAWCRDQLGAAHTNGRWCVDYYGTFQFRDEQDAIMFTLMWL